MGGVAELPVAHRDDVRAIADSFGTPDSAISVAPRQGQVNLTVFLGDDLVLRLPRRPDLAGRLATEAAVIPVVRSRGVPTARVIRFDADQTITDTTYVVLERLHGREIDDLPEPAAAEPLHRSLGEHLAVLHRIRPATTAVLPGVVVGEFSRDDLLDEVVTVGEIGASQAAWMAGWFEHLESAGARAGDQVLLHGDVMPSNLILDGSGRVTALIDWGSARWGEPARELAGFRSTRLPAAVEGYRLATDGGTDRSQQDVRLEAGVLWYQLYFAVSKLVGRPSTSEARNWSAPRAARLTELLRFVASAPPAPWASLLPATTDVPLP